MTYRKYTFEISFLFIYIVIEQLSKFLPIRTETILKIFLLIALRDRQL